MKIVVVLGADRVGKTTAIENTARTLEAGGLSVRVSHFSEIKPYHHSPIQQFDHEINNYDPETDVVIMDRFVSDTLFYESYRSQMPPIPSEFALTIESKLLVLAEDGVKVVLIEHNWDNRLILRHSEEIRNSCEMGCTDYWLAKQLEKRRLEHLAYYEHTRKYLSTQSLLKDLKFVDETDIYRPTFRLC